MSKTTETQKINKENSLELVKDPGLKKLLANILDKVPHEDIYKEAEEVKKRLLSLQSGRNKQFFPLYLMRWPKYLYSSRCQKKN